MEEEQSSEGGAPLLSMQISPHHRRRGRGSAGGPVQRGPGSSSRGSAPSAHWNRPTTPPRHWHEAQVDLNCSAVRTIWNIWSKWSKFWVHDVKLCWRKTFKRKQEERNTFKAF